MSKYKIGQKFFCIREENWRVSPESPGNPGVPDFYTFTHVIPEGGTIVLRKPGTESEKSIASLSDRYYVSCSEGYINGWFNERLLLEYFELAGEQLLCL